jgi:glycine/D-amino acid oxidase-like deaminating enzyme
MTSLWLADRADLPTPANPLVEADRTADVVVVGAGITGLITAVLLARAGKNVLVLEAQFVGAGATGNTTAKISLLQGTKLSKILAKHGETTARHYLDGNREGQDWLVRHCEAHGLSVQREDAFTYAQSDSGLSSAREEFEACQTVGLGAEWVDDADVPFPFHGGVRLADQAQFDPMPLLDSLIVELDERGGR